MDELPIYKINGKYYFLDRRLNEYRNIDNPTDTLNFNDVGLSDLQKPNKEDSIKIYMESVKNGYNANK